MAEALAQVKHDLGPGAVILHTRSYKQGGVLGLGAKPVVEITASDEQAAQATRRGRMRPAAQKTAHRSEVVLPAAGDLIRKTYAAAKAEMQQSQTHHAAAPSSGPANVPRSSTQPAVPASALPPVPPLVSAPLSVSSVPASVPPPPPAEAAPVQSQQLAEEMGFVREMVGQMMQRQNRRRAKVRLPDKLFKQYLALLKQQVAAELAEKIVEQVREDLDEQQLDDEQAVKEAVHAKIASLIPTDQQAGRIERAPDGRPRTIALVGPTGVGKTTTIAKLAATFKLKHRKKVALITIDTYRIAAVDQLRTYANIIKVPLHVALSPDQMVTALKKCADADVILIDTVGRSQRDDARLDQLAEFVRAARPHEIHLVLASTASESVMLETIRRFARLKADRIILTKLDEAVTFGVLLNVARRVRKKLSYLTTGQEVPQQIEPSQPDRLAGLVMGQSLS